MKLRNFARIVQTGQARFAKALRLHPPALGTTGTPVQLSRARTRGIFFLLAPCRSAKSLATHSFPIYEIGSSHELVET